MSGDRVGTTSGALKLPHSYPKTDAEHAANARELERSINEIPAGSPPKVFYGDPPLTLPGDGTAVETDVEFAIPAGITRFEGLISMTTADLVTGYSLNFVETPQGTVRGSLGGVPTGLGTDTVLISFAVLIIHDSPQVVEISIGADTDDGTTTTEADWQFTLTAAVAG